MSDNDNLPAPSKQTSSVPLKKETVRVTLKAADAPAAPPAPSIASAPVVAPPVPGAPAAPRAPGAPTVPLRPAGAAPVRPAPAPTVPLRPAGTASLPGGVALPKATVQLAAPTQPLSTPRPTFNQGPAVEEEEVEAESGVSTALAAGAMIAALVLLGFQLMIANTWIQQTADGSWANLFS
jgi:hypothetical protein